MKFCVASRGQTFGLVAEVGDQQPGHPSCPRRRERPIVRETLVVNGNIVSMPLDADAILTLGQKIRQAAESRQRVRTNISGAAVEKSDLAQAHDQAVRLGM